MHPVIARLTFQYDNAPWSKPDWNTLIVHFAGEVHDAARPNAQRDHRIAKAGFAINVVGDALSREVLILTQAGQFGGEIFAPLHVINSIQDSRESILQLKTVLRMSGVMVEDQADDKPMIRRDLDEAVTKQDTQASENDGSQVLRRAHYPAQYLQGAQLLWVDDIPDNNMYERRIFRSLGIFVDLARSTEEAIAMLQYTKYDVIISDLWRDSVRDAGLQFIEEISKRGLYRWTILYTGPNAANRDVPAKAFAMTARPDHLLHYVIDAIERERI